MNEKQRAYRAMRDAGVSGLALGIIVLVTGISVGILSIVSGARLLKAKSSVMI